MVTWECILDDNKTVKGSIEDGSWKKLKDSLKGRRIVSLLISSPQGAGRIDNDRDGYFISNKIVVALNGGQKVDLAGIGYWRKDDNVVRIKWYNKETMQLAHTEARELSQLKNNQGLITF